MSEHVVRRGDGYECTDPGHELRGSCMYQLPGEGGCPHIHQARDADLGQARAERDRLAAGVPLVCSDERHQARVSGLEAVLARVREYCEALAAGSCRVQAAVTARDVLDLLDGRLSAEDEPVPPASGSGADGEQRHG